MKKSVSLVEFPLEQLHELTLEELCQACDVTPDFIIQIIEFGVIEPKGKEKSDWRFESYHLQRLMTVLRLQRDLEVNLAGAALAVELLEEIEAMKNRLKLLEKHLFFR